MRSAAARLAAARSAAARPAAARLAAAPAAAARLAAGLLAAGALTGGLLAVFASSLAVHYGLPELGPVVDAGLPALRVLALGTAAACLANLLVGAVFVPGDPTTGQISPAGFAALRAARWWAVAQAVVSAAVAVLVVAENTGSAPGRLLGNGSALAIGLEQIQPASGWLLGAVLAALVAMASGLVLTWRGAVGLLVFALAGPVCVGLTTATNAQRSHDIAGNAVTLQLLATLVWLGSAIAAGIAGSHPATPRRHAVIARWCLPVLAGSSLVGWAYAVSAGDLLSTGFGRLVLVSAVLMLALLIASRAGRRGLECALLLGLASLATALTRVVPPAELGYEPSRQTYLIGYHLPDRLTVLELATRWRIDLVFAPLAIVAAALYLLGIRRRRSDEPWPTHYTIAWLAGCAVLLLATSSGLGSYGPAMFSVHMVQHMLLGSLAPALLVLGHGVTLARSVSAPPFERRLIGLLDASPVRLIGHPAGALALLAITLFGLYPTGLFAALLQQHWAHVAMNTVTLLAGLALFWSTLGRSTHRAELPPIGQLVTVFAVMAVHAGFSAWLLGQAMPVGGTFYASLELPFVTDPVADQRLGALLAWALGELPVILAVLALVRRWSRDDQPPRGVTVATPSSDRELASARH